MKETRALLPPRKRESLGAMTLAEIRRRWPSVAATVEQRKAQLDEIGVDDVAEGIRLGTIRYLKADDKHRRLFAGTHDVYEHQERINRELELV